MFLFGKSKPRLEEPSDAKKPQPQQPGVTAAEDLLSSAAATALAATSSPPAKPAAVSTGRHLRGSHIDIALDGLRPNEVVDELKVQPITLVKTDFKLEQTQLVAVSDTYICYGLKAGHIRALDRNTGGRALFKGHPAGISSMSFFSPNDNLLASVSKQGDIAVRLVSNKAAADGEEAAIAGQQLLAAQLPPAALPAATEGSFAPVTLAWHPTVPQILAAGAGSSVHIYEVPTAVDYSGAPPPSDPGITYHIAAGSTAAVASVAFTPTGDLLVAGDSTGGVHVWWLEAEEATDTPVLSWQPFSGAAAGAAGIGSVHVLHQAADASSLLITGNATNSTLKLWALPAAAAAVSGSTQPQLLQTVSFSSSKGGASIFCHVAVQPELQLVVLADAGRKQVYSLHYTLGDTGGSSSSSNGAAGSAAAAALFDYAAFFSVKQPILSLSTIPEAAEEADGQQLLLYCVQPDAIQQYMLNIQLCKADAAEDLAEEAAAIEELASSTTAETEPAAAAAAPATDAAAAPDAAYSAATESEVPPPAQLPTPTLLGARAAAHKTPAAAAIASPPKAAEVPSPQPAATPGSPPAAVQEPEQQVESPDCRTAGAAAAGAAAAGAAAAVAAAAAAASASKSSPMPPMPTSSLIHSAEKAPPTPAAAAAAKGPAAGAAEQVESSSVKAGQELRGAGLSELLAASAATAAAASDSSAVPPPAAAAAAGAGASAADLAELQQQMGQLLQMQERMAGQLQASTQQMVTGVKVEVGRGLKGTEASLLKQFEAALKASLKKAEDERRKVAAKERAELERMMGEQLNQLSVALHRDLSKVVVDTAREQARAAVNATVNAVTPAVAAAVASSLQQELTGSGSGLQLLLERSLASSLAGPLHEALRSNFDASLIPAFERATRVMFTQVESAFNAWLADSSKAASATQANAASGLNAAVSQLQAVVGNMRTDLSDTTKALSRLATSTASRAPVSPVAAAGGGAGAAARGAGSGAAGVQQDPRVEIGALLAGRQPETALVKALNVASPDVLLWTCKQMDPALVLGGAALSQTTLLSLVHQLCANLSSDADTALKLAWLAEAAPAIDPHDPVTEPHLRSVLSGVMASLKQLVAALPQNDVLAKKGKITLHLFNSLLHQ